MNIPAIPIVVPVSTEDGDESPIERIPKHPFPWRSLCRYCGTTLSMKGKDDLWVNAFGDTDCSNAPPIPALRPEDESDPGRHEPGLVLSIDGPVNGKE